MKTTVEIADGLLLRAKRHAEKRGQTLRQIVEEGLRRVLDDPPAPTGYKMKDCRVGNPDDPNPLEHLSWPELRAIIYGEE